jgi:hypothetical protein
LILIVQKLVLPALCFAVAFFLNEAYDVRRGFVSEPDAIIARAAGLTALVIFPLYPAVPSLWPSDVQLFTLFVLLLGAC